MNIHNPINKLSEKTFVTLVFSLIALYYLLIGLQGFDMCDEGWVLTGYQQFFNDPESVEYLFLYYLSLLVGGIWYKLFGFWGIYGFRILSAITISTGFIVTYFILKRIIGKTEFLIGILLIIFTQTGGITGFHYNHFTMLLSCLSAYFFYNALCKHSRKQILFSGFFVGIAVFARIPNITLLALVITLIPFARNFGIKNALRYLIAFLLGTISGLVIVVGVMTILGHVPIFIDNISSGFSATNNEESTHNIVRMIHIYMLNYYDILKLIVLLFLPGIILLILNNVASHSTIVKIIFFIISIFYFALIIFTVCKANRTFLTFSFCTGFLLYGIYQYFENDHYTYLILISFIIMNFLPIGSDAGIICLGTNCMIIAVPMSVHIANNLIKRLKICSITIAYILYIILIILSGLYLNWTQCFHDYGWRSEKIYKINSPLATTFTTYQNKVVADELLIELQKYIKKGDYALFFQSLPALHFLTETKPYVGNPWPWSYDPANFDIQLNKARTKYNKLPIIIREKSIIPTWQTPYKDWNNETAVQSYAHKNGRIKSINQFIKKNSYKVVWENNLFQILVPQ